VIQLIDPILFAVPFESHRYTKCITFAVESQRPMRQSLAWNVERWQRTTSSPLGVAITSAGRRFVWLRSENGKLRTTTSPFTNWPRLHPPQA
jgi:hypothetical protein